ncbi:MAG TPA: hypothetical protein VKA48_00105 [Gammaproteobacteria bacterium]|nr:hypothetical protein [Gammaproteobacteria bacterium]
MYDIRAIRSMYPHPMPARCLHLTERGYCVGGAIQCYVDRKEVPFGGAFPSPHTLSAVLRRANPRLNRFEARTLAGQITSANDTGEFERAWERAREALTLHYEMDLPESATILGPVENETSVDNEASEEAEPADASLTSS